MQIHELNNFSGTPGSTNYLAIDNGSDTSRISGTDLLKPVNERVDNAMSQNKAEAVTLWSGTMSSSGGTYTLSESVANFDYLEIYIYNSSTGLNDFKKIPANRTTAIFMVPFFPEDSVVSDKELDIGKVKLTFSGTSVTLEATKQWFWNGSFDSQDKPSIANILTALPVRIVGIRYARLDANELTDLRTAHDGTVYSTARAAREADYNALDSEIDSRATEIIDKLDDTQDDLNEVISVKYSKNRFNVNGNIVPGYLGDNGQLIQSGAWHTSDYCYVKGLGNIYGSQLNLDTGYRVDMTLFYLCTYDEDKNFIAKVSNMPSNPVTIESNVAYVRFSINSNNITAAQERMVEGGTARTAFEPYSRKVYVLTDPTLLDEYMPANAKAVGEALKGLKDIINYESVTIPTLIHGKLLNASTGELQDSPNQDGWRVSEYIETVPGSRIMLTTDHFFGWALCVFYDSDYGYISGLASESGGTVTYYRNKIIDVPTNAKYIRIGFLYQEAFPQPYLWQGIEQNALPSHIWSNKKWALIGDSLTDYNSRTSIHYFDYIAGATGIQFYNLGVSGSGYAQHSDNFKTKVQQVPLDSDVVTIFGSFNDLATGLPIGTKDDTGTSTLGGYINDTITNLFNRFPLANLGIVTPTPWSGNNPYNGSQQGNDYVQLIIDICKKRGIPLLDLYHESGLRPWEANYRTLVYSKDDGNGVHPDETGHMLIAPKFEAFLNSLLLK